MDLVSGKKKSLGDNRIWNDINKFFVYYIV